MLYNALRGEEKETIVNTSKLTFMGCRFDEGNSESSKII